MVKEYTYLGKILRNKNELRLETEEVLRKQLDYIMHLYFY